MAYIVQVGYSHPAYIYDNFLVLESENPVEGPVWAALSVAFFLQHGGSWATSSFLIEFLSCLYILISGNTVNLHYWLSSSLI